MGLIREDASHPPKLAGHAISWGVAESPLPGEHESGDRHVVQLSAAGVLIAAIDGMGHGAEAAAAAKLAASTLEEFAAKFSETKAARLLLALQEISDKEPELLEEGTLALFKVDTKNAPGGRIVFQKSGKLWYIRN